MTNINIKTEHKQTDLQDLGTFTRMKRWCTAFIKRIIDILASALALLFLLPVFGLIALGIKKDSEGPIFYKGTRVGRNGVLFKMIKFRTMYVSPRSYNGSPLTMNGDDRVTPYGQWLRDTKLNELPQLWNVLVGEMSLVGPRPECPDFVEKWPEDVRKKVLSIRPGITSPASILYRDEEKQLNGDNFMDDYLKKIAPDKLRLDLLYVDSHSTLSDLDVIFMTLLTILPRLRKVKIKEKTIFSGPLYGFYSKHLSWFLVDFLVAFIAVGIAGLIWRFAHPIDLGFTRALLLAFILASLTTLITTFFGLHRTVWRYASPARVLDVSLSIALTVVIVVIGNRLFFNTFILPLDFMLNFALLTGIGMIGVRYRERLLTGVANRWTQARGGNKALGERVLVVGAGDGGELAVWLLHKSEYASAFSVLGFVDDDYRKQKFEVAGLPVMGTTADIPTLVEKHDIGLILFSISKITQPHRKRILDLCQGAGVRVIVIPDLLEILKDPIKKSLIEDEG